MSYQPKKLQEFLEEFRTLDDREMQMEYLIELAERFSEVPSEIASRPFKKTHLVPGCESEAYVWRDEQGSYYFAVENPQGISAKAMAFILDTSCSNQPAEEVANLDPEVIYEIFGKQVNIARARGLMSMVAMVRRLSSVA